MKKLWGFIGALAIAIMTLMYGYYSTTKSLTISKISHDVIISPSAQIDGIGIYYNNEKISNLSKTTFVLENTGRISIKKDDIVSPIIFSIKNNAKVFDFILSGRDPSNIEITTERKINENELAIDFSLLNSGDKFNISVLSDSIEPLEVSGMARIEGIKNIEVKNDIKENSIFYSIFLWCCLIFSLISLLVTFALFSDSRKAKKIKNEIKNKKLKIPDDIRASRNWMNEIFSFCQEKDRVKIYDLLVNNEKLNYDDKLNLIENALNDFSSNFIGASIMTLVLGGVGGWYSLSSLGFIP